MYRCFKDILQINSKSDLIFQLDVFFKNAAKVAEFFQMEQAQFS